MANNVDNAHEVTHATGGGIAVANSSAPSHPSLLPALSKSAGRPVRSVRARPRRLPQAAVRAVEAPLIETDTAPGFSTLRRVLIGRGPISDLSVDPGDGLIYVANHADNSISVLDPATMDVVSTVVGTDEPFAIAAIKGHAYVSTVTMSHDAVAIVDPSADEPVANYPLFSTARDLAVGPSGRHVYVARTGRRGADVAILDTADGRVTRMNLGTRPAAAAAAITISRDGRRVYVVTTDHHGGELVAIDPVARCVVGGLAFPSPLRDVVVGYDGTTIYVASFDVSCGGVVDVVDTRSMRVVDSIDVGGAILQMVMSAAGDRLYVATGDRISVICAATREILDTVTVVERPSCVAETADGKRLIIADYAGVLTILTVASTTESLRAKMMSSDVIDIPMLELEAVGV
jgi:YVTN family beta-propeller protein